MKFYVEAYDENDQQILGNLDGQTVLRAKNYQRTAHYKALVNDTIRVSNRVTHWRIVTESGKTLEVVSRKTPTP